ncbi:unnamed protein product [Porites lobata]|uniref:Uncharacterized protein n=1 Tax=Porites lobata TaxID=104759 RepID=A0ABN8MXP0_9CNID|nr:unnamed protein product [Porites lobata]
MAAPTRRKGYRPTERDLNSPWRRSNSPASTLVNGNAYSPHMPRKRESSASPIDQEYKKNVDVLKREWAKLEAERNRQKETVTVTEYAPREMVVQDFQPFDLDSFLEGLHQRQQQEQQDQ